MIRLLMSTNLNEVSRSAQRSMALRDNWYFVVVVACIAMFWVGLYYWEKYRKQLQQDVSRPKSLFLELCQTHNLTRMQRTLLLQAAKARNLDQPAIVFVDPDVIGELAVAPIPQAPAYAELFRNLFGIEIDMLIDR